MTDVASRHALILFPDGVFFLHRIIGTCYQFLAFHIWREAALQSSLPWQRFHHVMPGDWGHGIAGQSPHHLDGIHHKLQDQQPLWHHMSFIVWDGPSSLSCRCSVYSVFRSVCICVCLFSVCLYVIVCVSVCLCLCLFLCLSVSFCLSLCSWGSVRRSMCLLSLLMSST